MQMEFSTCHPIPDIFCRWNFKSRLIDGWTANMYIARDLFCNFHRAPQQGIYLPYLSIATFHPALYRHFFASSMNVRVWFEAYLYQYEKSGNDGIWAICNNINKVPHNMVFHMRVYFLINSAPPNIYKTNLQVYQVSKLLGSNQNITIPWYRWPSARLQYIYC